jgi:hypothetical protein
LEREVLFNASEVMAAQRPRTGALLAAGLLRQLLLDQNARQLEANAKHAPDSTAATKSKVRPSQSADSRLAPVKARARRADATEPRSSWSLLGMVGANYFFNSDTPLIQAEFGAQRALSLPIPTRLSASLLGNITRASDTRGTVWLGGVGLRAGPEIGLWRSARLAQWIAPSAAIMALALSTQPSEGYRSTRSYRAVVIADLRVLTEYLLTGRHRLCGTIEAGITPHYLRVQIAKHTLLAYQGLYFGFSLGYSAALL